MVNSQLLPTVKLQVKAHMTTTVNEPQPCGTDSDSTCEFARLRWSSLKEWFEDPWSPHSLQKCEGSLNA